MVATIQVIIDKHLPVAGHAVLPAGHPPEIIEAVSQPCLDGADLAFERLRRGMGRMHPHPAVPHPDMPGRQRVLLAPEGGHAIPLGNAHQVAGQIVHPAMVGAGQAFHPPTPGGSHPSRPVPANIAERPQFAHRVAGHHHRLASQIEGKHLARLGHLLQTAGRQPTGTKNSLPLTASPATPQIAFRRQTPGPVDAG